jgi:acetyl-CoA acetyltransferase
VTRHPVQDVVIVGVHNTRQGRVLEGETSESIAMAAVLGALADAGLTTRDVDGINVTRGAGYPSPSQDYELDQYDLVGARRCWSGLKPFGIEAILEAALAIAAGLCTTVVIGHGQAGAFQAGGGATAPWTRPSYEFTDCWGLYTAAEFALLAQIHMHRYGTRPEHLAEVASTIRTNGSRNPEAVMAGRGDITPDDVLASRMIAEPFHLLDCCLTSEGGAAVVLTTRERAADVPGRGVHVLGADAERRGKGYARPALWEEWGWVGEHAAAAAFGMAGCGPADVDVCELYDPFSFEVIHQFEASGFCERGEGGPFVMDGRIRPGGEFPICTDGGLLSFSHNGQAQMLQRVIEGVRQVRGEAGPGQVPGAEVVLVSNDAMASRAVALLGSGPVA